MSNHVHACMQDIRKFTQAAGQDQGQVEGNLWASYRQAVGKLKARLRSRLKATYRQAVGKLQATMGQLSLAAGCFKARNIVCKCVWETCMRSTRTIHQYLASGN